MRHNFILWIAVFSLILGETLAQDSRPVADPITDYIQCFRDTSQVVDLEDRWIYKLEGDFNQDGRPDIALGDPFMGGAQDCPYDFYLMQPGGKYKNVGQLGFEDIVGIKSLRKGTALLTVLSHISAEEGTILEYRVSARGIKSLRWYNTSCGWDSLMRLPGAISIPASRCKLIDLLHNVHSKWQ